MARTDKVITGIFVIGLTGYLTDKGFALFISKVLRGAEIHDGNQA
jgi:sulfonate transport system permease protein